MKKGKLKSPVQKKSEASFIKQESISKSSNAVFIFLLGLVIAFVLVVRLQFLHIPFERDEGTYCYMGQLVLDGKVPYLGFYEMKPPLLFYSYAALIFTFGKTVEAMHVAFMMLNIFTIIILYFVGKKLLQSSTAGIVTAASYAVLSLAPGLSGFSVQAEHLISFFVAAGVLLLLSGFQKNRLLYFFFSGILFCSAFLVKQNGIFFLIFAGIIIPIYYFLQKPIDWKQLTKTIASYSAGVLFLLALTAGVLYVQGALKECLFWTYTYASGYVSSITLSDGWINFKEFSQGIIKNNWFLWVLASAGFILPFIFHRQLPLFTRLFAWLFAILSFMAIAPGLRFFGHYWLFFMPSIALLIAVSVISISSILSKYLSANNSTMVALSIFGLAVLANIIQQRDYYFDHDDTRLLRQVYGMNPFPEAKVVGDYIKQNSTEKDSIVVFGSEPEIYFYTGRRCPSKHCDGAAMLSNNPKAPVFQKEFERDLQASVPRYFIVFKNSYSINMMDQADTTIFTWLGVFLQANYYIAGIVDMVSPENTQYVWGDAVNQYKMGSGLKGYVFERKKPGMAN